MTGSNPVWPASVRKYTYKTKEYQYEKKNDVGKSLLTMVKRYSRTQYLARVQMKRKLQLLCWPTRTIAILKPFMFTKK